MVRLIARPLLAVAQVHRPPCERLPHAAVGRGSVAVDAVDVALQGRVSTALSRGPTRIVGARTTAVHVEPLTQDAAAVLPHVALGARSTAHLRGRRLVEDVRLVDVATDAVPPLERDGGGPEVLAVEGGEDVGLRLLVGERRGAGAGDGLVGAGREGHRHGDDQAAEEHDRHDLLLQVLDQRLGVHTILRVDCVLEQRAPWTNPHTMRYFSIFVKGFIPIFIDFLKMFKNKFFCYNIPTKYAPRFNGRLRGMVSFYASRFRRHYAT